MQDKSNPLRFLDDASFIDHLHRTYGAVPEAIRQSEELRKVFLPILPVPNSRMFLSETASIF